MQFASLGPLAATDPPWRSLKPITDIVAGTVEMVVWILPGQVQVLHESGNAPLLEVAPLLDRSCFP